MERCRCCAIGFFCGRPTASRNLITSCLERSIKIQQSLIMWLTKENPLFARGFHQMPLSRRLSMPNWILSGECPSSWSKAGSISHSERKYHTLHVRDFANVFSWEIFTLEASRAWNNYIGLPMRPRAWKIRRPTVDEL